MKGECLAFPEVGLTVKELQKAEPLLETFVSSFRSVFRRSEQASWFHYYLRGLLSDAPRKSVEAMVLHQSGVDGNLVRAVQHFLTNAQFDTERLARMYQQYALASLASEQEVFVLDGSDFPKQGASSAGVARQRCGQLGKVANCQAGVFLGLTSPQGNALLAGRLYIPQAWFAPQQAALRAKCGIPETQDFQTKNQLALALLEAAALDSQKESRWVVFDDGFGHCQGLLDSLGQGGWRYMAQVSGATCLFQTLPEVGRERTGTRGPRPTRLRILGHDKAQEVQAFVSTLQDDVWETHVWKEGTKGPMRESFAILRVWNARRKNARTTLPGEEVWLVVRKGKEANERKYWLSNAPKETSHEELLRICASRWSIETMFKDCKQLLGMGDYEVRSQDGWMRHTTMAMMAHFFLRFFGNLGEATPRALHCPSAPSSQLSSSRGRVEPWNGV